MNKKNNKEELFNEDKQFLSDEDFSGISSEQESTNSKNELHLDSLEMQRIAKNVSTSVTQIVDLLVASKKGQKIGIVDFTGPAVQLLSALAPLAQYPLETAVKLTFSALVEYADNSAIVSISDKKALYQFLDSSDLDKDGSLSLLEVVTMITGLSNYITINFEERAVKQEVDDANYSSVVGVIVKIATSLAQIAGTVFQIFRFFKK